jgi:ligand-binding sensor domain-containing protein/serine phosphatase RsbU (regulator of sigma subunit)
VQDKKRIAQLTVIRSLWALLILLFSLQTHAQKVPFVNYTIQNGLPQNVVNAVCQDRDGYIWFATQMGAARFDGFDFEYFTVSNGLPDNQVNCLLAARNGDVWMGTEMGIARFNGKEFTLYDESRGLVNNRVDRLVEDLQGNLWISTAYGLSVVTPDTILSYTEGTALFDNAIMKIFVDSRGRVHVSTQPQPGITIFEDPYNFKKQAFEDIVSDIIETSEGHLWYATQGDGIWVDSPEKEGAMVKLGYRQGLTDERVLCMTTDHLGRIWCGTYLEGLFIYEGGRFRKFPEGGDSDVVAASILEDRNQRIWVVDFLKGIWLVNYQGMRQLTMANNLVYDVVTDLMEDRFGNIWIATISGASKYGRAIFEVFDSDGILPDNNVLALFFDSRERLWFGTYGHLMYLKNNQLYTLGESKGFNEGQTNPLSFAEDQQGNLYVGTDRGLLYYNGRSFIPSDHWGKNSKEIQFFSLLHTPGGELWCGTDSGLYILHGGQVRLPDGAEGIADRQVNAIDLVGERIWCATQGGLSEFSLEGRHLANYYSSDGLASDVCNHLTHDAEGNLWVATDRGVSKIGAATTTKITSYQLSDGLTSNSIYFLAFSDSTSLWLGTERGLYRMNTATGESDYYGTEDGFYPLDTYRGAVAKGKGKELWMGTVSGLVHYLPGYHKNDPVPPDLILYPPMVDGQLYVPQEQDGQVSPTFPFNRNTLAFHFTGIHTTLPSKNKFSFILEGYDDEWSVPGKERSVTYRKIPNGEYIFKVRAYNLDGVPTELEASFAFNIKPPFWKTFWFILLEVLAGLSLAYAAIQYRERQLIREKRVLEARVKQRTREIEEQKVKIETQRDEIAQKNKEITDSIHYAKHIQQAILPGKLSLEKSLPEHFIFFRPRDIVSGDFYWVEEKQERIIICAADCTGHGVPGAFMSLLGLTFLNEIVNKDEILKASEILNRLRVYIIRAMSHKDIQTRDGMDLSLVVIDRQLNLLEFSGANNPLVIIRGEEFIEYKADKMPIGRHEGEERSFTNHKVPIRSGDMVYLFSDGFADQFGGEKGGKYKAKPFRGLLQRIHSESAERQEQLIDQELLTWMGDIDQVDDILVMGIRYIESGNTKSK